MREMGLAAVYPGPNLSKRVRQAAIYPYLPRNVAASAPNHVWGIDITYIRQSAQLEVSGCCAGLVLPICSELGVGSNLAAALCARGGNACASAGSTNDLE